MAESGSSASSAAISDGENGPAYEEGFFVQALGYVVRGVCDSQEPCSHGAEDRLPVGEHEVCQGICKVGGADGRAAQASGGGNKGRQTMDA